MIRLTFLRDAPAPKATIGPTHIVRLERGRVCIGSAGIVVATFSKFGFEVEGDRSHSLLLEGPFHAALEDLSGAMHADLDTHENLVIGNGLVVAEGELIARLMTGRWATLHHSHGADRLVLRAAFDPVIGEIEKK